MQKELLRRMYRIVVAPMLQLHTVAASGTHIALLSLHVQRRISVHHCHLAVLGLLLHTKAGIVSASLVSLMKSDLVSIVT